MTFSQIKTPFYLYDFAQIKQRFLNYKNTFNGVKNNIFYAVKANSNLSLLRFLSELGSGFDCVSANEIRRALIAGAKPYKIIFSGVGKTREELQFALESKILYINVESEAEMHLLESLAKQKNCVANISIRLNPNIDAKTHPYISTGLKENKFGVSFELARKMFLHAKNSAFLNPVSVHFHIGSNLLDLEPISTAAIKVLDFVKELKAANIDIKFFDIGGGVGVAYEHGEKLPELANFSEIIKNIARQNDLTICAEPGRYIVANAGKLITKVLYEKTNEDKRFVICDASMCELMRPSLYGAFHKISTINCDYELKNSTPADVVGGVCESGDFLGKNIILPPLKSGDLLQIEDAGAYGFAMSSNYNSRTKIAEFALLENGEIKQITRAQSFDEMIACELECLGE